jgi:hypothetical protein
MRLRLTATVGMPVSLRGLGIQNILRKLTFVVVEACIEARS